MYFLDIHGNIETVETFHRNCYYICPLPSDSRPFFLLILLFFIFRGRGTTTRTNATTRRAPKKLHNNRVKVQLNGNDDEWKYTGCSLKNIRESFSKYILVSFDGSLLKFERRGICLMGNHQVDDFLLITMV